MKDLRMVETISELLLLPKEQLQLIEKGLGIESFLLAEGATEEDLKALFAVVKDKYQSDNGFPYVTKRWWPLYDRLSSVIWKLDHVSESDEFRLHKTLPADMFKSEYHRFLCRNAQSFEEWKENYDKAVNFSPNDVYLSIHVHPFKVNETVRKAVKGMDHGLKEVETFDGVNVSASLLDGGKYHDINPPQRIMYNHKYVSGKVTKNFDSFYDIEEYFVSN